MEDTIKCPSFNKQTKSWVVPENGFKTTKTGPSLQIHFSQICSTDCTLQIAILNTTCKNRDIRLVSCRWVTFMPLIGTKLLNYTFLARSKPQI